MKIGKFEINGKKILVGTIKTAAGAIVSFGAGYIITRYGKAAILPTDKTVKKLVMTAGAAVLAGMVGDAASNYLGKQIDSVVELVDGVTTGVNAQDCEFEEEEVKDVGSEQ